MGDELHNRHSAASSLFANQMALAIAKAGIPRERALPTLGYLTGHNLLFLGLAMASGKAIADPARDVEYSSLVVAMCRNGTEFGIQVAGLGDEWFVAPSPVVDGLFLPGFSAADAGLDMGDSAITETVGWGAFTLVGAPGILALVGGTNDDALAYTQQMRQHHDRHTPDVSDARPRESRASRSGIDIRKVVQTGISPIIDTGIAHREAGHPIIGAGLVRAPMDCFKRALAALGERYAS